MGCRMNFGMTARQSLLTALIFLETSFWAPLGWAIEGDAPADVPAVPFLFDGKKGLVLPKKELNFGTVTRGGQPQGELDLLNNGQDTVTIKEIKSNCDCLKIVSQSGNQVAPGKAGKLAIVLDTENSAFGDVVATGSLTTDEKLLPTTLLTVTARIEEEILLLPSAVSFWGKDDPQQKKTVMVEPLPSATPFKIERYEADDKLLQVAIHEGEHGRHEISVQLKAMPETLPAIGKVMLFTNAKVTKRLPLYVYFNKADSPSVSPFMLDLGELAEGARTARKFVVAGIPAHRGISLYPQLGESGRFIDRPDEILTVSLPKKQGNQSEVQIELLHNGHFHGTIHGKIRVIPDDPALAGTAVDFRAFFAEKKVGS